MPVGELTIMVTDGVNPLTDFRGEFVFSDRGRVIIHNNKVLVDQPAGTVNYTVDKAGFYKNQGSFFYGGGIDTQTIIMKRIIPPTPPTSNIFPILLLGIGVIGTYALYKYLE